MKKRRILDAKFQLDMNEVDNTEVLIKKFEPMVSQLSAQELKVLNKLIVSRLQTMHKAGTLMAIAQFRIGERVCFNDSNGIVINGIIVRLNHKSITVRVGLNEDWKVSPQLLRKID
jgi:hypothetical protein